MKNILILLLLFSFHAYGSNRFSRPDGTWSTTDGGANCSCVPGQNDNIVVNHNITITGPFTLNTGTLTVNSPATLTISGNLTFNNGSTVTINSGAKLQVNGNFENKNNSNNITFNGAIAITGNFKNGSGAGTGAVIDFGPTATISIGGTCSNNGTVTDYSGSYSGCNQGVLPIKLLFFQGKNLDELVVLNWATALEENFLKFEIERSSNGIDFNKIGEVTGFGQDTKERHDYSFTDAAPLVGKNYYRLKNLDNDASFEYSVVILIEGENFKNISLFPNPVEGDVISVRTNFEPGAGDKIIIIDNLGQARGEYAPNSIESAIPLSLGKGTYLIRYITNDKIFTIRFVVD